jgi:ribose-phosphate pyrophosphokinase
MPRHLLLPLTAPILYAFPPHEDIGERLKDALNVTMGAFRLARFPNNELYIQLDAQATEQKCIVLGSIAPPDTNLFSFLLLCHTLKTDGAQKVTAVLPYLAYSRHDKKEPQQSRATALIGQLFGSAGADEVVTVDVHSPLVNQLFPIPLVSLSPARIFAQEIARCSLQSATIVAPDEGAINRCEAVAKAVGIKSEVAYLTKKRTETGVTHRDLHGSVGRQVVIVDDMLDTGGTLISCCEKLLEQGVEEIYIMVTHGLFTGTAWEKLWELRVQLIYCTDTIPLPENACSKNIIVLSVIPLLVEELIKD